MIKGNKYIQLNKRDHWDGLTFYSILYNHKFNCKFLRLDSITTREYDKHSYADWCYAYYPDFLMAPLDKLTEWNDIYYGIDTYIYKPHKYNLYTSNDLIICEPDKCFKIVNEMIKGNGEGCEYLPLTEVTMETPCGYYFTT